MKGRYRIIAGCKHLLLLSVLLASGCVAWVDRPPPPKLPVIEASAEDSATLTVVRRKQFALSGVIFTVSVDGVAMANLESGQYTRFPVSPEEHTMEVRWDIGGVNILGGGTGGAGFIRDSVQTHKKAIAIRCHIESNCFITIEAQAFAGHEEERVIVKQVDRLEGEFSLEEKSFTPSGVFILK